MSWETTAPFLNDLLRLILIAAAVVFGSLLIWAQRGIAKQDAVTRAAEADAKVKAATAELIKQQKEAGFAAKDITTELAPGDAGIGTELVKGLSTSAPLLAGGIFLYILAAVILGALTFSVGAAAGDGDTGGTDTTQCDTAADPTCDD